MESKDSQFAELKLIVNGTQKPWPVEDYINSQTTIDLNWGLDSDYFEADVVSFTVKQLIEGQSIPHVKIDIDKRLVLCTIPIREKIAKYKIIIDWKEIKTTIRRDLIFHIDGKVRSVEDGCLVLSGNDARKPIKATYCGKQCDIEIEDDNIIYVAIPEIVQLKESFPAQLKRKILSLLPGIFFSGIIVMIICISDVLVDAISDSRMRSSLPEEQEVTDLSRSLEEDVKIKEIKEKEENKKIVEGIMEKNRIRSCLKNRVWRKHEMENCPELKGLYDDMNKYRFNNVVLRLRKINIIQLKSVEAVLGTIEKVIEKNKGSDIIYNQYPYTINSHIDIFEYCKYIENVSNENSLERKAPKFASLNQQGAVSIFSFGFL